MKLNFIHIFCLFLSLGLTIKLSAQSLVNDADTSVAASNNQNTFTETIKIISSSKKIFILTNSNQQLTPGDFISLALSNNLAARALVAKTHQGQVGIKILKIYSLTQWGKLRRDQEVQIIKGDDSMFGKIEAPKEDTSALGRIKSEEDLFSKDVVVSDDVEVLDESKNRHIKPDNVVGIYGAYADANEVESRGGTIRATEYGLTWAYQFRDNFFVEGIYGRALFDNYPGEGASTLINRLSGRLKYNIKGPLYTFFMPYVGYQNFTVSSPNAGKTNDPNQNEEELAVIDDLQKSGVIAGVSIYRRLVPGWFVKADLGTDVINLGFAVEF